MVSLRRLFSRSKKDKPSTEPINTNPSAVPPKGKQYKPVAPKPSVSSSNGVSRINPTHNTTTTSTTTNAAIIPATTITDIDTTPSTCEKNETSLGALTGHLPNDTITPATSSPHHLSVPSKASSNSHSTDGHVAAISSSSASHSVDHGASMSYSSYDYSSSSSGGGGSSSDFGSSSCGGSSW